MADRARFLVLLSFFFTFAPNCLSASEKTLVISAASDPKSFNEVVAQETSTSEITGFLFEGLTRINTRTGDIEPLLAEKWEESADGLSWTFYLRKGVVWFDGRPFTSRDVVFTFRDLVLNPKIPAAARDIFTLKGKMMEVEADGEHVVRFRLPGRFAPFLSALSQSIYPEHLLAETVKQEKFVSHWGTDSRPESIVGTGPFRLHRYVPGERLELIRNERYWKKDAQGNVLPRLSKIVILIVPSPDGRLLKFLQGEIDVIAVTGQDYPVLKPKEREKNFTLIQAGAGLGSNFLVFNQGGRDLLKKSWFQNKQFRKAAAHALDRDSIIETMYNRLGGIQCSPLSPAVPFYYDDQTPCYDHNPEKAREILREAGFQDRNGDGFLDDSSGKTVEFVLMTNAENPERLGIAALVREDLARIGMKVHFLPMEFNALVTKLVATREWDAVLMGLTGTIDPHFGVNVWRSNGTLHFWNPGQETPATAWERRVDEIFEAAVETTDRSRRKALYNEWQGIVAEELPMIYTTLPTAIYAVRNKFTNLKPTVFGGPFPEIETVDIRE